MKLGAAGSKLGEEAYFGGSRADEAETGQTRPRGPKLVSWPDFEPKVPLSVVLRERRAEVQHRANPALQEETGTLDILVDLPERTLGADRQMHPVAAYDLGCFFASVLVRVVL